MNNHRGFTLIELIAVMLVIATICALVLPNSGKIFTKIKITSTVRQICALLNYARGQAVISGTDYKVNFHPKEKTCWLTKKENDTYIRLKGREGKTLFIPEEFSFQPEIEALEFSPKGNSTGGEIVVEDFHIVVDEVTGLLEVVKRKKNDNNPL